MSELRPGQPGYGVPADQLLPETTVVPKPPLRNKPDGREFLDPERYRRLPPPPPETRPKQIPPAVKRSPPLAGPKKKV